MDIFTESYLNSYLIDQPKRRLIVPSYSLYAQLKQCMVTQLALVNKHNRKSLCGLVMTAT